MGNVGVALLGSSGDCVEHTLKVMLSEGPGSCSIDPPVPVLHG